MDVLCPIKKVGKVEEKQSIMSLSMKDRTIYHVLSMKDREISPSGPIFNHGLSKPHPWLKFQPSGEISLSYIDTQGGLL